MRLARPFALGVLGWALVFLCVLTGGFAAGEKPAAVKAGEKIAPVPPEAAEFFETHVRPVLADNCFACHGAERQMAGLRLDAAAHLLKGSDRGPVLVPGDAEKSALIRAVRYDGKIKMPPQGKLPAKAIEALTQWVKMGAPWPAPPTSMAATPPARAGEFAITAEQRGHWAFQPVKDPPLPKVRDTAWPTSPIDSFILAALEKKGLRPAPPADRLTLLRRATLDLTGLPPTIAEIDAFLADHSPAAFARVVDRLLASPRYGERWGRHWLDVARYADTKGYSFTEDSRYPNAYTYRDYVIRAFNEDLPYDQFIIQQLAADRLPLTNDKRPLAAMGFLTVGRRFLNSQPDIIDDRIDVTCRGLMSLTVGCARCHNHKFDPIPTKDYYSLYGVFASSDEPAPVMITPAARNERSLAHQKRRDEAEKEAAEIGEVQQTRLHQQFSAGIADYLLAVRDLSLQREPKPVEACAAERGLNPLIFQRWQGFLNETPPAHQHIFRPWHALISLPDDGFAAAAAPLTAKLTSTSDPAAPISPLVSRMLADHPPCSLRDLAQRYGALFSSVEQRWARVMQGHTVAAALATANGEEPPKPPMALPDAAEEAVRQVLYGKDSPLNLKAEDLEPYFEASARERWKTLRQTATKLREAAPLAPEYAMALEDAKSPRNPRVFIRGNPGNQGDEVPRQFLLIAAGEKRRPFQDGSGRLELARAIASGDNPLTARVMVNRIWLHHFGAGLVRTPGDFGMRSEPPTHPELLDYLAAHFIEMGWSIKRMHRLIMLSSAYQMSSDFNSHADQLDPENRLLWRQNRQRLELEALRDSLLAVSGRLDPKIGGPAVEITKAPYPNRRTVYGFIDRQNLQGLFRTFDLASPDTTNAQRYRTTVPQQALFMMNSPFVVEQARGVASRPELTALKDPARQVRYVYRLLYGRLPTADELSLGLTFVQAAGARGAEAAPHEQSSWRYGYGFFDAVTRRVTSFQPLPHWTGQAWQGGPDFPDRQLQHLRLTATGGHPGPDAHHAAIRRWVAPRDAVLTISGTLGHVATEGDGVQARVVSNRGGELGAWTAHAGQTDTLVRRVEVRRGDTLDFIVDGRADPRFDSFTWSPTIRAASPVVASLPVPGTRPAAFGSRIADFRLYPQISQISTDRKGRPSLLSAPSAKSADRVGSPKLADIWSAESGFGGPAAEASKPLTVWEKYLQVLLMTNEFAFVD